MVKKRQQSDHSLMIVSMIAIVAIVVLVTSVSSGGGIGLSTDNLFGEKLRIETVKKESLIFGCINPEASNYNPDAVLDDGSCEYLSCQTSTIDYISHEFACSGEFVTIYGQNLCTPMSVLLQGAPLPNNLILSSTSDEVKFIVPDYYDGTHSAHSAKLMYGGPQFEWWNGVGDYEYSNFLSFETGLIIDGVCFDIVLGCTDENACNYNSDANADDGSCESLSCLGCTDENACNYCISLHTGANLKSFYALPDDTHMNNIMAPLGDSITGVITEGGACTQISPGSWVGSECSIMPKNGYWVIVTADNTLCLEEVNLTDPNIVYDLHAGANLISFPAEGSVGVSAGLPDDVESFVTGVITEGGACNHITPENWVGSQCSFIGGKGYWIITSEPISFAFNLSTLTEPLTEDDIEIDIPDGLEYSQSMSQAFYIFTDGPFQTGDLVVAYNDEVVIGSSKFQQNPLTLPLMGDDGSELTENYANHGSVITINIHRNGEIIEYTDTMLPTWQSTKIFSIG